MNQNPVEADLLPVPLQFEQLTRESDVRFYTGLTSTESFKCVFRHLLPKARNMQYWRGPKQTDKETPLSSTTTAFEQFAGVDWSTTETCTTARTSSVLDEDAFSIIS